MKKSFGLALFSNSEVRLTYLRIMSKAALYLIPVPLSGGDISSLSPDSVEAARHLNIFVAERAKSARQFLKSIRHPTPLNEIIIYEYPQKTDPDFEKNIIILLLEGASIGLVSEAGVPCIADPGFELVSMAQDQDIRVVPFAGPNSIVIALMASGFSGQQFCFHGYLPAKKEFLRTKLIQISQDLKKTNTAQIFIETPYRNKQVLEVVKNNITPEIKLCIASGALSLTPYLSSAFANTISTCGMITS